NLGTLRTFRVFRALKTVAVVPGSLKLIVGALMEAVIRLRDVIILTLFMLSIFSLIGLQMYHGKLLKKCVKVPHKSWIEYASPEQIHSFEMDKRNWLKTASGDYEVCDSEDGSGKPCPQGYKCEEVGENPNYGYTNFDNFYYAFLCSFRLMTLDSWESLYQLVLKSMGEYHMIFFIFVVFLGSFYLINLILAIVATSYDDCRKREEKESEELLAAALYFIIIEQAEEERQIALIEEAMQTSPALSNVDIISQVANIENNRSNSGNNVIESVGVTFKDISAPCLLPMKHSGITTKSISCQAAQKIPTPGKNFRLRLRFKDHSVVVLNFENNWINQKLQRTHQSRLTVYINLLSHYLDRSLRILPIFFSASAFLFSPAFLTSDNNFLSNYTSNFSLWLFTKILHKDFTPNSQRIVKKLSRSIQNITIHKVPFPSSDLKNLTNNLSVEKWQLKWIKTLDFLKLSMPSVNNKKFNNGYLNRHLQSFINRLNIGHSAITHFWILNKTKTPNCEACNKKLSIQHILTELSFKESKMPCAYKILIQFEKLLFGWEYPLWWQKISKIIEVFVMDPFLDLFITFCIIFNTIILAIDHADIQEDVSNVLRIANLVFTVIFTTEVCLKITALGFLKYLANRWNSFDLFIVVLSLAELGLQKFKPFSILRSFRLLRIFKLAKSWPTLNLLILIIGKTVGALGNLCLVLAIIIFIFAVMGMQLFKAFYKSTERWNFCDFLHSFMIVFRVLCGEWIESMWNCMMYTGSTFCIPFFLLTMIIGNLVVLNLFLALLLSSFGTESLKQNLSIYETAKKTKLQEAVDRILRFALFLKYRTDTVRLQFYIENRLNNVSSELVQSVRVPCLTLLSRDGMRRKVLSPSFDIMSLRFVAIFGYMKFFFYFYIKPKTDVNWQNRKHTVSNKNRSTLMHTFYTHVLFYRIQNISRKCNIKLKSDDLGHGGMLKYVEYDESSLLSISRSSSFNSDLVFMDNPKLEEVAVVRVNFPDDCCPKKFIFKNDLWAIMMRSKYGRRWWAFRCYCKKLVENKLFESFIIVIIILSSLSLAFEDKNIIYHHQMKLVLEHLDKIFTIAFSLELVLKMIAHGPIHYFKDAWCWLDFIIVLISFVGTIAEKYVLNNMTAFRALRTFRALRPLKAVSRWEGMKVVVNALFQAIPAIFNVLLVCLVFWLIFGIMGVTLFAGKFDYCRDNNETRIINNSNITNKNDCLTYGYEWYKPKVNFDNVAAAYLALFQVATFKGWMEILANSADIKEKDDQPEYESQPYTCLYFVVFIIFGSFFTLNLFIGVIIDNFNVQKRKAGGSLDMFLTEDQKRYYNAMKKLGSKKPRKPIPKPKMKCQLYFFKLVSNDKFDMAIMFVIVFNMLCMAIEHHNQPKELEDLLDYFNQLFVAIFTLEFLLKLIAFRIYYFKHPWNVFDFSVVIVSILGLAVLKFVKKHLVSPTLIRVIRVFRVGRILRLVKSAKGIRTLLFSLAVSLPALFNIGLLLFLIMFIYAVFGMSFFMNVEHKYGIDDIFNFETVYHGLLILFQIATSAGWNGVLEALMNESTNCTGDANANSYDGSKLAIPYLVTYLIISFLVIINMYIAVILENFSQATEDVQRGLTQDDIDMYYETWEKFDEHATGYIKFDKLSEFLDALEEPLGIPVPNYFVIIHLDIPICDNDLVHCVDILDALTKYYLGTSKDAARELGDVKKGSGKKNYSTSTTTLQRQREIFCAKVIQVVWRKHVEQRRMQRKQTENLKRSSDGMIDKQINTANNQSNSIECADFYLDSGNNKTSEKAEAMLLMNPNYLNI
ncbi:hypothetical protein HELRODRAFT_89291, partial [Helobdella robusta]|uniref:Sodium channel protein n=1 Tax=Helobdella robusta TaxID=6412 RepID=T1G7B6_HELRO